jgi:hypothetical protein
MIINRTPSHQSDKFCFPLAIFKKKAIFGLKVTFSGQKRLLSALFLKSNGEVKVTKDYWL